MEAIKLLSGQGTLLGRQLLTMDLRDMSMRTFANQRRENCLVYGFLSEQKNATDRQHSPASA
ncbi:MAG: hypothetical protein ACFBZ8_03275 [Opitutales bacterium]